ncbi:hypothetical protein GDO86_014928 [Hymenochirus boettgeri]|uniref:Pyroglutamylated RFamide peptide n=1 Tax=Hymenochirus boettgeri TaxID=247094 RepID=A0A8T2JVT3_9PIPI|nr:hypothetical protein GDO86_014928 [Hymenochirus boettgeri]
MLTSLFPYTDKVNYGLSVWLLLSLGSILALQDSRQQEPWGRIGLLRMFPDERKSMDPASLFSVAKELQGFGKERAGFRFRFGRQEEGNEIEDFGGQEEEKRDGTALGSLAEELNGFNRKKGGFSFRFGNDKQYGHR